MWQKKLVNFFIKVFSKISEVYTNFFKKNPQFFKKKSPIFFQKKQQNLLPKKISLLTRQPILLFLLLCLLFCCRHDAFRHRFLRRTRQLWTSFLLFGPFFALKISYWSLCLFVHYVHNIVQVPSLEDNRPIVGKKKHEKKCLLVVVARQQFIFRVLGVVGFQHYLLPYNTHAFVTKF